MPGAVRSSCSGRSDVRGRIAGGRAHSAPRDREGPDRCEGPRRESPPGRVRRLLPGAGPVGVGEGVVPDRARRSLGRGSGVHPSAGLDREPGPREGCPARSGRAGTRDRRPGGSHRRAGLPADRGRRGPRRHRHVHDARGGQRRHRQARQRDGDPCDRRASGLVSGPGRLGPGREARAGRAGRHARRPGDKATSLLYVAGFSGRSLGFHGQGGRFGFSVVGDFGEDGGGEPEERGLGGEDRCDASASLGCLFEPLEAVGGAERVALPSPGSGPRYAEAAPEPVR